MSRPLDYPLGEESVDQSFYAAGVGWPGLNSQLGQYQEKCRKSDRRWRAYRFATVVLSLLLIGFVLTMRAYDREMAAAAVQLRLANQTIRRQQEQIIADHAGMRACNDQMRTLEESQ